MAIDELSQGKSMQSQQVLGPKVVGLVQIQVNEDRIDAFDRRLYPFETQARNRWLSIAAARLNGQAMPAVDLIKVGEVYVIRDGHRRISVARALGEDCINAHVTTRDLA